VTQIDTLIGKRGRSAFLAQAAEKELMKLRREYDQRFEKTASR
jgi:hypothetical protein